MLPFLIDFLCFIIPMILITTQLVIPLWKGTKIFPIFRSDLNKVSSEISKASSELEVAEIEKTVKKIRRKTNQTKTTK